VTDCGQLTTERGSRSMRLFTLRSQLISRFELGQVWQRPFIFGASPAGIPVRSTNPHFRSQFAKRRIWAPWAGR